MRLKMCSIHVQDPAAAHTFYTETLGFETLMAMPEYNLFIIKDPGADQGSARTAAGTQRQPDRRGLHERAAQGRPARHRFRRAGRAGRIRAAHQGRCDFPGRPAEDPSGISAVFDDGCGNFIQLHQD
jgi:catechol 2,3-dioxygenase-like lactoylglutathione lyase family enzyme